MGADLAHNLGDGEGSEILLKEKCLDDVVSWLGERLKDFTDDSCSERLETSRALIL
jgi:hypothetical protein